MTRSSASSRSSSSNMNTKQIDVGGIPVDVVFKNIKNIHLSVHPPTGRVRISAPRRMKLDTLRIYAISKINWIKKHQKKSQDHPQGAIVEREGPIHISNVKLIEKAEKKKKAA